MLIELSSIMPVTFDWFAESYYDSPISGVAAFLFSQMFFCDLDVTGRPGFGILFLSKLILACDADFINWATLSTGSCGALTHPATGLSFAVSFYPFSVDFIILFEIQIKL